MKKYFFMAVATLVVSAAAVVGVKAYNHSQLSDLALANIEALSREETYDRVWLKCVTEKDERCEYKCRNKACGITWYNPSTVKDRKVIEGKGKCPECHTTVILNTITYGIYE